jgi:hypothetical protein
MNWKPLSDFFYKLKYSIFPVNREVISLTIEPNEVLVRGILHPFFYSESKKKLKETAFLPPPNSDTVSFNRLRYTNAEFCKQHAKTINFPDNSYCGLATIVVQKIIAINEHFTDENVSVVCSPINEFGKYVDTKKTKTFVDSAGLPMHADLMYEILNQPIEPFKPQTRLRKIANEILKHAIYYEDPFPNIDGWQGKTIS